MPQFNISNRAAIFLIAGVIVVSAIVFFGERWILGNGAQHDSASLTTIIIATTADSGRKVASTAHALSHYFSSFDREPPRAKNIETSFGSEQRFATERIEFAKHRRIAARAGVAIAPSALMI
jgi:hypothetical protein